MKSIMNTIVFINSVVLVTTIGVICIFIGVLGEAFDKYFNDKR